MSGGSIKDNEATTNGGGVVVSKAGSSNTFTITGGTITGNKAASLGGGIYNNSILNLEGGTIGGSSADDMNTVTGTSGKGGAVFQGATCTMKGSIYIPFGYKERVNDVYIFRNSSNSYPVTLTGNLTSSNPIVATITPAYDDFSSPSVTQEVLAEESNNLISNNCSKFNVVQRGDMNWYNLGATGTNKGYVFADNSYYVQVEGKTINTALKSGGQDSKVFISHRTITIPHMFAGVTELRQSEYEKYCYYKATGISLPPDGNWTQDYSGDSYFYPAYGICIYDMFVYCNLRSMAEGLDPVYELDGKTDPREWSECSESGGKYCGPNGGSTTCGNWNSITMTPSRNGWRLPTEAEWEYLARGGKEAPNNSTLYSGSDTVGSVAWYRGNSDTGVENSYKKPRPCKQWNPNSLGLFDMSGNVYEMCWDWQVETLTINTSSHGGTMENAKTCVNTSSWYNGKPQRIVRGGSVDYVETYQSVIDRTTGNTSNMRWNNCGARIVRTYVEP